MWVLREFGEIPNTLSYIDKYMVRVDGDFWHQFTDRESQKKLLYEGGC